MPAAVPALVMMSPSSTNSTSGSSRALGKRSASSSTWLQWVVQRRPSSKPAAPSTNAPLHTEISVAPRAAASRSASSTAVGYSSRMAAAGTATRSARSTADRSCSGMNRAPTPVRRGLPGSSPQTRNSTGGTPSSVRSMPKTSQTTPNSNGATWSISTAATVVSMPPA